MGIPAEDGAAPARPRWVGVGLFALLALSGLVLARCFPRTIVGLRGWIEAAGVWAPLVFTVIQASRGVTWIPGGVLSPLGGLVFGFWPGLAYSWIGLLAAAALGFGLTRLLRMQSPGGTLRRRFHGLMERVGGRMWLGVLLARLLPLIPFNVVSYLAGASRIRWGPYLLASAVGLLPRLAIQVGVGAGIYAVAG